MKQWHPDYQDCDIDIADYRQFVVPGCPVAFRGPAIDPLHAPQGSFFSCLGAAQTFGRFISRPFPDILAEANGLDALNLSVGGAGPGFVLQYPELITAMNRGRFVILQCMSARHESNSRFRAEGYIEYLNDMRHGDIVDSVTAWTRILDEEPDEAPRYLQESRESWLETTRKLVSVLTVPVVFFWFSRREPDLAIDWEAIHAGLGHRPTGELVSMIYGEFPQLIDRTTADRAAEMCAARASYTGDRGMGAPLISLTTGRPINPADYEDKGIEYRVIQAGRNLYYPSAEMHEDAARSLQPVIESLSC